MTQEKIVAFIDIGTNSARLLVVSIGENGAYHMLTRIKDVVRLGEGEYTAGKIQEDAGERLMRVLKRFMDLSRSLGATEFVAMATSAMREAVNSQEIVGKIGSELGLEIQIISGKEEARLIHLGVAAGISLGNETALFIDIGGGSTELIVGGQYTYAALESMRLGAIRVTGQCIKKGFTGALPPKRQTKMMNRVMTVAMPILQRISAFPFTRCIGSSGTTINLAEIAQKLYHAAETPKKPILLLSDLENLYPYLCSLSLEERRKVPGINPDRADIILAGAAILLAVMKTLKIPEIEISDRGLREGILMDYLAEMPGTPQSERMPVKEASILQLGRSCRLEEKHAQKVQEITLRLFDSAKECGLHNYGAWERELLAQAAWLHDVGDFLSFVGHHQHGEYIIRNTELLGFDQREILILAKIVRYHRKKLPGRKDSEFGSLTPADRDRVRIMALFLRCAELLNRSHADAVADVRYLCKKGDAVVLDVVPAAGADLTLELTSLVPETVLFAKVFGKKLILQRQDTADRGTGNCP
ncbi:MAG TPA: Ppx/GppA phosphatase family protein [Methanocorpusculum sp.]|nr:Ppx/GppA phosphatase family protein [Methanocorpusculum sp.]HJK79559.1 Ppx/GppA phosphatase family protein [Methanocorpusculum sp.]